MTIGEMYNSKVTSIHDELLRKKDTILKIDVNNLYVCSLQGLLLLFLDKHDNFANKNEEFYNPSIKEVEVTINGMFRQLFAGDLLAGDIYPEIKKYFHKENSDATWEEFLTTKFGLWIDTRSSIDNTLHGSGKAVEKGILLQIERVPEASDNNLTCYVFSLEDVLIHLSVNDPSSILTTEK